jgi:hypothetical protein
MNIRQFNNEARIVAWLNRKNGDEAARERVIRIVRWVRALARAEPMRFQIPTVEGFELVRNIGMDDETPLDEVMQELRRRGVGLEDMFGHREFDYQAAASLDSILARFQYRPYCNLVRSDPALFHKRTGKRSANPMTGKLILHMVPSGWNPRAVEVTIGDLRKANGVWPTSKVIDNAPSDVQEAFIVQYLIGITRSGNIDRVRECQCGKWFLAARADKRYCGENCRKKYHSPSEEQKEKRRKWRRDYQKRYWKQNPSRRSNRKASSAAKAPLEKGGK